jgi:nucleolar GTP-binding protein
MLANGGAGVYACDFTKHWDLADPSWRTDAVPEIMDGKNIADFIDPDIEEMLAELEAEEEELLKLEGNMVEDDDDDGALDSDEEDAVQEIKTFKGKTVAKSRLSESSNRSVLPKKNQRHTLADFKSHLATLGIKEDVDTVAERVRSRSKSRTRVGDKRGRSETPDRSRSASRGRSATPSRNELSMTSTKRPKLLEDAVAMMKKAQKKIAKKNISESDRKIPDKKPKWAFSGKMDVRGTRNKR